MKWGEGNTSEFKKKKASGMMPNDFPTIDVKDETHQTMMEIEPLLIALGYRTRRYVLLAHGEYLEVYQSFLLDVGQGAYKRA